ncbi:MAG: flagellar M-ring protein FliF [Rhodospirillales bacterium]|nr:flagellar M-ring protein FliF [Rhodospirillales bacterium]
MKPLLDGLKALGPARLGAMAVVALGLLGLLAMLAMRATDTPMALLYGGLDTQDASAITAALDAQHIAYRLDGGGGRILVPADQVARLRLMLAAKGIPSGGTVGYEIFDRSSGLAATSFQDRINETRAMEGELARTISAMSGVRAVRVHLVLPHRAPFARHASAAQASIMLTMAGIGRLDREEVAAIQNLVAAAVPQLRPQNITIVDNRGDLLARAGSQAGGADTPLSANALRLATERRLDRAVERMLEQSLGPGHVRAEAAVQMSFDKVQETAESFNPDGQVPRSQQSVDETSTRTDPGRTVSVQNNLPNANASTPGAGSTRKRREETTNYEISKTVRTVINDQPQIKRISIAVMVDGVTTIGKDGKPVWTPQSPAEIARIGDLVKSAIGYDAKRGDVVQVVSMRFAPTDPGVTAVAPGLMGLHVNAPDVMHLAETALFGVIGLLALLLVLRPMVTRITALPRELLGPAGGESVAFAGTEATMAGTTLAGTPALGALPAPHGEMRALPGGGAAPGTALLEDDSMVQLAQIEGAMRASSLRRIADLVDKHPEETVAIMRGWMAQEAA